MILSRLERKIQDKEALAEGLAELKVISHEDEFDALERSSTTDDLPASKYAKMSCSLRNCC
ncbi:MULTISPECIES: hypothetical protein [Clostridium]|uniref:Uncharacterized protein n=1 Tax=Clostridium frigoriphilum TaxID=443253 RepID=A0ABU7UVX6_9CLOT|nr:hypothetical protein [Clostridium sp. DSM 17811]MBU3100814.1 hypothetical protein [Clostridium sp. DSM 17811]